MVKGGKKAEGVWKFNGGKRGRVMMRNGWKKKK